MSKPVKRSIAVAIFSSDRLLSTRRANDDDELPGIWGLPAGSYREGETTLDLIERIGRDKLGVKLHPVRQLNEGLQERPTYQLLMELWEASMEGLPSHPDWQWASLDLLRPGAVAGSLCCELAIKAKSRISL